MRKIIAAMNMTLDGYCDHTAGMPGEDIHRHYTQLLDQGGAILYGRTTYQLMEFWRTVLENPSKESSMNEFARAIDRIPKIVFSHTMKQVDWESTILASEGLEKTVSDLRKLPGKDILVGSRSLIIQLINLNLIDELQLCIYPVVEGKGLPLFDSISGRTIFQLLRTKTFSNGAIILYYTTQKG